VPAAPDIIADVLDSATPRARPEQPAATGPSRPRWAERVAMPGPMAALLALTVIGAALRFATLDVQSIWLDEAATLHLVDRGFSGMLSHISSGESTPPLYYVLVWAWTKVFGTGPIAFRAFSALAGTALIPVLFAAGRRISPRVGLWAAALATVNPGMYYYSQEARSYALLILLSAVAFVCWQRALERPDTRRLAYWALASALALLTHYFAVFLFVPEAALLIKRLGWRKTRFAIGAVVLVGAALAPLALAQTATKNAEWIQTTSIVSRFAQAPKQFLVGLFSPQEILTAAVSGLLALAAVALLVRRGSQRERSLAWDVAIVAFGALALPAVLALTHIEDVFNGRNVIAAWTPFAVLVAAGLGVARAPRLGALLGAGLCLVSVLVVVGVNTEPGYQRDDWRGLAQALKSSAAGSISVTPQYGVTPLSIFLPALRDARGASVTTREIDFLDLRGQRTGRSPSPPSVPSTAPPGFRAAGVRKTDTLAVARFVSATPRTVSVAALRKLAGNASAEIVLKP
jgi:mannosyltransferase